MRNQASFEKYPRLFSAFDQFLFQYGTRAGAVPDVMNVITKRGTAADAPDLLRLVGHVRSRSTDTPPERRPISI